MLPVSPEPVKLFVGLLYSDRAIIPEVSQVLESQVGRVDYGSSEFNFDASTYYQDELGWPIYRSFWSIEELIDPGELAQIKVMTNRIEDHFSAGGKRRVNLDPGYMDFNKIVLASAKFNSQKIYLAHGIYADPTMFYQKGEFRCSAHAFPDFRAGTYSKVFLRIRDLYKEQGRKRS